jgi:hypothetical protein
MTRGDTLREARTVLLLGLSGWAVAAVLLWRFGSGSLPADLDLFFLAVGVWVTVPMAIIAVRRVVGRPTPAPRQERGRTSIVWAVIAVITCQAIVEATRPITQDWTTLQVWAALALLTPFGVAVVSVPRLLRPEGWTGLAAGTPWHRRTALVGGALGVFAVALFGADWLIGGGSMTAIACDPTLPVELCQSIQPGLPTVGTVGWAVFGLLAVLAVVNVAFDLAVVAAGLIGLMYVTLGFWLRYPWNPLLDGSLQVASPVLVLILHVAAASALITAAALLQVYREPAGSDAEQQVTEWLRAEAFLPERRPAERNTAG